MKAVVKMEEIQVAVTHVRPLALDLLAHLLSSFPTFGHPL